MPEGRSGLDAVVPEDVISREPADAVPQHFHHTPVLVIALVGRVDEHEPAALGRTRLSRLADRLHALGFAEQCSPPFIAGFVHVPFLPEQAALEGAERTPSMSLDVMKAAVEILITTVVTSLEQRALDSTTSVTVPAAQSSVVLARSDQ